MKVSDETKNAYAKSSLKKLNISFPDLSISVPMSRIYAQSLNLSEMLIDENNVEFVGCISSRFEIQLSGVSNNIKGQKIEVSIVADDTEEIPLFQGIVDSAVRQTNKNYKKIIAYDELYTKGNIDVAAWYNGLTFPITIKELRDSFFSYIGIEQEEKALPNDDVTINKELAPTIMAAKTVFKSICQINGAFGIINRYGKFEYRILSDLIESSGAYPGLTLYPYFYPGIGSGTGETESTAQAISYYKKVDYEEYTVKPVEKVTIRQSESDAGVSYGDGTNNYIIQGNMFMVNQPSLVLERIAKNIHGSIAGIEFTPFFSDNNGYPFIEVGKDSVSYVTYDYEASNRARSDVYTEKVFYVFKRTLSGIQSLKDIYSVSGDEYQTEFITDLQTQIETIKNNLSGEVSSQVSVQLEQKIPEFTYTKQEADSKFSTLRVLSVNELPSNPDSNTIYLIRGEVTVT